jgi:hypothetical protein
MNRVKTYSQDLTFFGRASPVGATHEGIAPCALVRLMRQARGLVPMWRHVGLSRAKRTDVTQSRRLLWCD